MVFSEEDIEKFAEGYAKINEKYDDLIGRYFLHKFENDRAREFAYHGFSRRLKMLKQCIFNIFAAIPPERETIPTKDELSNATINLQAFVFNVFGCLDNLAWIWVEETELKKENGESLPKGYVGLRAENKSVRGSFRPDFQKYLKSMDEWMGNLEDFRHALAHRIPLYIPPHCVSEDKQDAYDSLERQKRECSDPAVWDRLEAEQMELCNFRPIILHSFEENSNRIYFHPQAIADFNTVVEMGEKILEELAHKKSG
ncbi:MAG: hypothetical protein K9G33_15225 [Sneathiella sp.]|nr:hypothetical protein [Sneathiella sp.]